MNRTEAFYSLITASALAAFLVVPSLAEDMPPRPEPIYVWQGNHVDNPNIPQASARTMPPSYQWQSGAAQIPNDTASGILQPVQIGSARYITGGIGEDERDALEAVKNQYNLRITSASVTGEFNGDTKIAIRDARGAQILSADAGPIFYADLPAGTYTVEAMSDGRTQAKKINVGQGKSSTTYFRW